MTTGTAKAFLDLNRLPLGGRAVILSLRSKGYLRRRLLDLGFVPGTVIEAVRRSPFGDPTAYRVRGALIALREEEAEKIVVMPASKAGKGGHC